MKKFCSYIDRNWIKSNTWPPVNWSVFRQDDRTNNDVEGWHNRINEGKNGAFNLFHLIDQLHYEATLISLQAKLMDRGENLRRRNKACQQLQDDLVDLWDQYTTMIYHLNYCWKKLPPYMITTIRPAIVFKLLMILKAMSLQIRCTLNFRFFLFFLSFGSNKTIYQQCLFRLNLFLFLSFGCNKSICQQSLFGTDTKILILRSLHINFYYGPENQFLSGPFTRITGP